MEPALRLQKTRLRPVLYTVAVCTGELLFTAFMYSKKLYERSISAHLQRLS
jgi:hypothetical protein